MKELSREYGVIPRWLEPSFRHRYADNLNELKNRIESALKECRVDMIDDYEIGGVLQAEIVVMDIMRSEIEEAAK